MTLIGYTMMGEQAGPKQLVRDVALAEQAGFDFAVISDHYFPKVPQHRARRMAVPAGLGATRPPAQRGRQPEPVGQPHQQRRPSMPGDSIAVAGDLEPRRRLGSLHRKVPSSARECDLQKAAFSLLGGPLRAQQPATSAPTQKPRLVGLLVEEVVGRVRHKRRITDVC